MTALKDIDPWPAGSGNDRVVFVMGCGRSGTHWLASILESHPDVSVTVETPDIFPLVVRMAMVPTERHALISPLVEAYRKRRLALDGQIYADKSHPSMWIAHYLADAIPTASFVGIERDPYQTVASMIRHEGVSDWTRRWREFPVPNAFLGIDQSGSRVYEGLSLTQKHALRWKSHHEQMRRLQGSLGDRVHVLQYSQLHSAPTQTTTLLRDFLGLRLPLERPIVAGATVAKYRQVLTDQDIDQVRDITGVPIP